MARHAGGFQAMTPSVRSDRAPERACESPSDKGGGGRAPGGRTCARRLAVRYWGTTVRPTTMRFLCVLFLALSLATPAGAKKREFSEAELHYREGGKHYRAKRFPLAIVEYEKSLALGG